MTEHEKKLIKFEAKTDYKPLELYSLYDKRVNKYMPPFFCSNSDDAERQCMQIVNYTNSLINKFPQDYALYFIGYFYEDTGCLVSNEIPLFVAYLDNYKTEDSQQFDEVKKEITEQKFLISNALNELQKKDDEFSKKIKDLSVIATKYENKLTTIEGVKPTLEHKKFILKKLFSK